MRALIEKLEKNRRLEEEEYAALILAADGEELLFERARETARKVFGKGIYIRGLIEFTNYCKNDCYYCGIRMSNRSIQRYRLTPGQILDCCKIGRELGFYTFVLQGGEDGSVKDEEMAEIVGRIKERYPDCAVTLSIGERSRESYALLKAAGADRYLLRHETADPVHYAQLHPKKLSLENRIRCLYDLKELGFQVGTGFMVGSPGQTARHLAKDLMFIQKFEPQMVGIGPFIPHKDTPFGKEKAGTMELTLRMIAILRLMLPNALIPATTALGTIHPQGREKGILAGANVVMPNLSPRDVRQKYLLYNDKISTGEEAAEGKALLEKRLEAIGYYIEAGRGDFAKRFSDR